MSFSKNMCQGDHNGGACGPFLFVMPKVRRWSQKLKGLSLFTICYRNMGHCSRWTMAKIGECSVVNVDVKETIVTIDKILQMNCWKKNAIRSILEFQGIMATFKRKSPAAILTLLKNFLFIYLFLIHIFSEMLSKSIRLRQDLFCIRLKLIE